MGQNGFYPSLREQSSHGYFSLESIPVKLFPWLNPVIQDSQKISICPQPNLCSSSPEHPSRLGTGLGHTSPPLCTFWPCSGPVFSKGKVQGWRENKYCNLESNKLRVCQGPNNFWETMSNLQFWLLLWAPSSVLSVKVDSIDFVSELKWVINTSQLLSQPICVTAGRLHCSSLCWLLFALQFSDTTQLFQAAVVGKNLTHTC